MASPRLPDDPPPTDRPVDRPTPGGLPEDPAPVGAAPPGGSAGLPGPGVPGRGGVAPESRQLPPHQGKLARIGDHVASLSTDIKEWVELRIDLAKAEVREAVDALKASLKRKGIAVAFLAAAGVLALYALGFLFGALAWGLAALFESVWLGMLVTSLLLFAVVAVLALIGKRKLEEDKAIEAKARVSSITESSDIHPTPPSTRELQDLEAEKARAAAV